MIKTNYDTLRKLHGLARHNNFNANHKELYVKRDRTITVFRKKGN